MRLLRLELSVTSSLLNPTSVTEGLLLSILVVKYIVSALTPALLLKLNVYVVSPSAASLTFILIFFPLEYEVSPVLLTLIPSPVPAALLPVKL